MRFLFRLLRRLVLLVLVFLLALSVPVIYVEAALSSPDHRIRL